MGKRPKVTKKGVVQKIIKTPDPKEPEKAEIIVLGADELYREIRIENALENERGEQRKLKKDAEVEVAIEADEKDTVPGNTSSDKKDKAAD